VRHLDSTLAVEIIAMSNEFEANCITKRHRESRHEHIMHLGNTNKGWQLTR
jgi:hypothetical protein